MAAELGTYESMGAMKTEFQLIDADANGSLDKHEVMHRRFPVVSDQRTPIAEVEEEIKYLLRNLAYDHQRGKYPEGNEETWKISKDQAKRHVEYFVQVNADHSEL